MSRLAALALLVDGMFQIAGQSDRWSTLAYRDARDQTLFAAHLATGLALAASAALLNANPSPTPAARRLTLTALAAAFVIALIETTWFNWTGTVGRALYSAAVLFLARKHRTP